MRIETSRIIGTVALLLATVVPTARAQIYGPWSAPVNLNNIVLSDGTVCPAVVNSTSPDANDTHPAISKDGLSLYFASTRPKPGELPVNNKYNNYHLWVTNRAGLDSCWVAPMYLGDVVNDTTDKDPVTGVEMQDFAPNLAPDGHWLYFHSNRPGGCGKVVGLVNELWAVHRDDTTDVHGWGGAGGTDPPINLGCATNGGVNVTTSDDAGPNYFDAGNGTLYLYFTRNAFPKDQQGFQIYISTCTADIDTCNRQKQWGVGVPVGTPTDAMPIVGLNSQGRNTRTAIRRDGLEMILSSGRGGSFLSENLWVSTRTAVTLDQGNWEIPQPVNCDHTSGFTSPTGFVPCSSWNPQGPPINSDAFDGGPALSWDGTELYFFRVVNANNTLRTCTVLPTSPDTDTSPYCRDLYRSTRTYITNTVLSSSPNPSVFGQSVTFTAIVSSANDSAPTGTVAFSDGSASLGAGTLASGQATFTTSSLAVGSHSITGQYGGDRISSGSSGSVPQNVEYGICPLYDQTRSVHSGATFPIRLQLCDANGNNLSSSAIVVQAMSVTTVSGFSGTPASPGNANPDNNFRFDATIGLTGGYIFNLSTAGLASGTHSLQFTAGSDPVSHSVNFGVN